MTIRKRWIALLAGLVGVGSVSFALAFPAPMACLAINAYGFEPDSERFLVPGDSNRAEKLKYKNLVQQARERITIAFGQPEADPIVVFFNSPRAFWPLHLNLHGQAPTIGARACLIIGPNGQNIDVVAHELMHAEMRHRVGSWTMFRKVPAWFDEGVAMQMDYRERYAMSHEQLSNTTYVREFKSYGDFFNGQNSYAAAKREVRNWLTEVGVGTLYGRLDRMKNGAPFSAIVEQ